MLQHWCGSDGTHTPVRQADRSQRSSHGATFPGVAGTAREVRQAMRHAVHAYVRDPSDSNAFKVERAVMALRQDKSRSTALALWRGQAGSD